MAALAPFGGGMGSSGQVCGSLSGALAVIGFTLGKTGVKDKDHKVMWKISYQMVKKFSEIASEYGGTNCHNISQVNWKDGNSVKKFYTDPESNRKNCVKVIRETCIYLQELIQANFPPENEKQQEKK